MPKGQFGPYRLVQQIAVGGMAEIHLAKTKGIAGFEKFVALKMIHPNLSEDQEFIEMLIDEAKLTVQLQHVNIAQTFDLGRVDETFYITMEFVDGADLYKMLRTGADMDLDIPIEVAGFIAKEVANGLDYAHRKRDIHGRPLGIVHRDVSPQNVLISHSGEVKIVDFGIAKATMRVRKTAVGVIKGKYYYMSPEQAWGEIVDLRSDIFSVGILLYEMLTGQMLYLEEDLHKLLGMVRKADIASPTTLRAGIPPRLERIVMRALARKPEDRYQSAADLAADLERFLHAHSPVFTQTKVVSWMNQVLGARQPIAATAPVASSSQIDEARSTKRLSQDELFLDSSEFTDHNSVIFNVAEFDKREAERALAKAAPNRSPNRKVVDFDEPTVLEEGKAHLTGALGAEFIKELEEEIPGKFLDEFEDRPTIATGMNPIARGSLELPLSLEIADVEDFAERTIVSGPPTLGGLSELVRVAREPRTGSNPVRPETDLATADTNIATDAEITISNDERTLSDGDRLPFRGLDEPTAISDPETRPGRLIAGRPHRNLGNKAPRNWEAVPALAAQNPKPAVSVLRRPRQSRRTPPGIPVQAESVLSNLLTGPGKVPKVAMSPLRGGPDPAAASRPSQNHPSVFPPSNRRSANSSRALPPRPMGSPFPGMNPAMMNTSMQMAAVAIDDIPDRYKLRRGLSTTWIVGILVVIALIGITIIAAVLGGDGEETLNTGASSLATIHVVSTPAGGAVFVDGEPINQQTPAVFQGAEQGKTYVVAVELERHQRWESKVSVPQGEREVKVIARMQKLLVSLIVESKPSGAEVFLNGKNYGRTPLVLSDLDPDLATDLVLRLRNYEPKSQQLHWSKREQAVHLELRR